jgi:hypothetical protein
LAEFGGGFVAGVVVVVADDDALGFHLFHHAPEIGVEAVHAEGGGDVTEAVAPKC